MYEQDCRGNGPSPVEIFKTWRIFWKWNKLKLKIKIQEKRQQKMSATGPIFPLETS